MTCSFFRQQLCGQIHIMKSVKCNSAPWAEVALIPRVTLHSSQLWARLVPCVWLDHWGLLVCKGSRQWGWEGEAEGCISAKLLCGLSVSVSLLFGDGECRWCHLLGSLCSNTRGGRCYMTGDCDIQGQRGPYALLSWLRVVTLPGVPVGWRARVSDSPSWSPVKEVP